MEAPASEHSGVSTKEGDLRSPALPCQGVSLQPLASAGRTRLAVIDNVADMGPRCLQVWYMVCTFTEKALVVRMEAHLIDDGHSHKEAA